MADEFKRCPSCEQTKPVTEFYVSRARAGGRAQHCKPCQKAYLAPRLKDWYRRNREMVLARSNAWKQENSAQRRTYNRQWRLNNLARCVTYVQGRNARKLKATPAWADDAAIKAMYELAAARTAFTGVKHHVDHIVPLRAKTVCGLHVQQNLQVLTFTENRRKGNHWWPDMPGSA